MTDEVFIGISRDSMLRYLEERGWEHYPESAYEDEVLLLPGRIQFEGHDALARAYVWQRGQEQG